MAAGTDRVPCQPTPRGWQGRAEGPMGGNEMIYFVICQPTEEDATATLYLTPGAVLAEQGFTDVS